MKMRMILLATGVALAAAAAQTRAEVSIWDSIPSNRTAVIVVDVQVLQEAPAFKALEGGGYLRELDEGLKLFEDFTGFNVRRDLSLLVVGKLGEEKENDLAFFQGRFKQEELIAAIKLAPDYDTSRHGDVTIHTWFDQNENRQKYGAFLADDLLVVGPEDGVKSAIDTRANPSSSFGALPEVIRATKSLTHELPLCAVSRTFGKPGNPFYHRVTSVLLTVDLKEGFAINLALEAKDGATAGALRLFGNAIIAMGKLANGKPETQALAENASISQNGNTVVLSTTVPNDKFTPWLLEQARVKAAKKQ